MDDSGASGSQALDTMEQISTTMNSNENDNSLPPSTPTTTTIQSTMNDDDNNINQTDIIHNEDDIQPTNTNIDESINQIDNQQQELQSNPQDNQQPLQQQQDEDDEQQSTSKKSKKDKKEKKDKKSKKDKKEKKEKKSKRDRKSSSRDDDIGGGDDNDDTLSIQSNTFTTDGDNDNINDLSGDENIDNSTSRRRRTSSIKSELGDDDDDDDDGFGDLGNDDDDDYDDNTSHKKSKKSKKHSSSSSSSSKSSSSNKKKRSRNTEDDIDDYGSGLTEYDVPTNYQPTFIDQSIDENLSFAKKFARTREIKREIQRSVRTIEKVDLDSAELVQSVQGIIYQMQLAACHDRDVIKSNLDASLNGNLPDGRLALQRVMFYPVIARELNKSKNLLMVFLENNLLAALRLWIMPNIDGTLPPLKIRKPLYELLLKLPVQTTHLSSVPIGETVFTLIQHPHELAENRALLNKVVHKWVDLITKQGLSKNIPSHMTMSGQTEQDLKLKRSQAKEKSSKLNEMNIYNIPSNAEYLQAKRPGMEFRQISILPRGLLDHGRSNNNSSTPIKRELSIGPKNNNNQDNEYDDDDGEYDLPGRIKNE